MLSSLKTRYFQFLEHCRQEDFLSACRIAIYKSEEIVPAEKDLDTLRPVPEPEGGDLPLLDLGPENFDSHRLDFPLRSRRERAGNFLRRGYRMIAMVREGRVVGDVWYVTRASARTQGIHPHLDKWFGIELGADEAYLFDMHVDAEQRGGGLTTYFHGRVLETLRERGFRRAYGSFVAQNIPALWMHRLIDYRELPRCIVRRIFLHETVHGKI